MIKLSTLDAVMPCSVYSAGFQGPAYPRPARPKLKEKLSAAMRIKITVTIRRVAASCLREDEAAGP